MGIPVGWQVSVGGILSADHGTQGARSGIQDDSSCGWYNVDAEDYLGQGSSHMGLDGKLKKFLQGPVELAFPRCSAGSDFDLK